jgi:hypothetical protein
MRITKQREYLALLEKELLVYIVRNLGFDIKKTKGVAK